MLIIAEIGTSHEGDLDKAYSLIDAAAEAGADAIKFQWVYADEILHPLTGFVDLPTGRIPLYERFRQLECPPSFYKNLLDYTHKKGCKFCCSPFGLKSLNELLELQPDYVKIASPELNHYKMLEALRDYRAGQVKDGKEPVPVIISSGVSKMADIEKAFEILGRDGVSFLHCVTSYPAPEADYKLGVMRSLGKVFGVEYGVSDHSLDPMLVPSLCAANGGSIIEEHFTLSKKTSGLDDPVALEPEQFALMVHAVGQTQALMKRYGRERGLEEVIKQFSESFSREQIEKMLFDCKKELAHSEEANYGRTNRSLHFMRDMKKGEVIGQGDIAILRTEKVLSVGISPAFYDMMMGASLTCDVKNGEGLQFNHVINYQK